MWDSSQAQRKETGSAIKRTMAAAEIGSLELMGGLIRAFQLR